MKLTLQHTVTLLLTLSILLGSVGVALSEQLCIMTGLKQVSAIAQKDDCCQEPKLPSEQKDSCCKVDVSFEKLEPVATLKYYHLAQPAYSPHEMKLHLLQPIYYFAKDKSLHTYTDSSPPLFGRSLLQKIQILLI